MALIALRSLPYLLEYALDSDTLLGLEACMFMRWGFIALLLSLISLLIRGSLDALSLGFEAFRREVGWRQEIQTLKVKKIALTLTSPIIIEEVGEERVSIGVLEYSVLIAFPSLSYSGNSE
jgi:hypothetical protein